MSYDDHLRRQFNTLTRSLRVTSDADADAVRVLIRAFDEGAAGLGPESELRADFVRNATALRTSLLAWESEV